MTTDPAVLTDEELAEWRAAHKRGCDWLWERRDRLFATIQALQAENAELERLTDIMHETQGVLHNANVELRERAEKAESERDALLRRVGE